MTTPKQEPLPRLPRNSTRRPVMHLRESEADEMNCGHEQPHEGVDPNAVRGPTDPSNLARLRDREQIVPRR